MTGPRTSDRLDDAQAVARVPGDRAPLLRASGLVKHFPVRRGLFGRVQG